MTVLRPPVVVLLGMMARMRVGGAIWQTLHYLIGLRRLGYEAYYVEAHNCGPQPFIANEEDTASFIDQVMRRFDMGQQWAYHARSGTGRYYGMSGPSVSALYQRAAAVINLHGGTVPNAEHASSQRLVYIDTDPVRVQVEIHHGVKQVIKLLEPHCAFFTFAENYGNSNCELPVSERFPFKPTRQPVVLDFWRPALSERGSKLTTIGNWQQMRRFVVYEDEEYQWSKHFEFLKFLDLPKRTPQAFELALASYDPSAKALLEENGWEIRDALSFSLDLDQYRNYIVQSRGEFTVAKDQNIRLRTGWFSDRSATYLAAGRPVITQQTGFSDVMPIGEGLFAFSTIEEILSAIDAINSTYARHSRAASEIAQQYFSHEVVIPRLLSEIGVEPARGTYKSGGIERSQPE